MMQMITAYYRKMYDTKCTEWAWPTVLQNLHFSEKSTKICQHSIEIKVKKYLGLIFNYIQGN